MQIFLAKIREISENFFKKDLSILFLAMVGLLAECRLFLVVASGCYSVAVRGLLIVVASLVDHRL